MNDKVLQLSQQRDDLIHQIIMERAELAQQGAALHRATRILDQFRNGIRHVKNHPEILLLPAAAMYVLRPRRLWAWGLSGLSLWRMARNWQRRIFS